MIIGNKSSWPKDLAFQQGMMESLFRMKLQEDAMAILSELIKAAPNDPALRRRYADELHRVGNYAEAEKHYQALLQLQRQESMRQPRTMHVRGRRTLDVE
jgi:predicted Zn-dependent protease